MAKQLLRKAQFGQGFKLRTNNDGQEDDNLDIAIKNF